MALERYGHDARYPIGANWRGMTHQLLGLIDTAAAPRVWLVGHSMGGYLSLIAAGQRPERICGVILLDSPIISGWRSGVISAIKAAGLMYRVSPAALAARRRQSWASQEEVFQHFAVKPKFRAWPEDVLRDYVATGTEPDPADASGAARRLRFYRDVEAAIYATVPHWLVPYVRRHALAGPIAFIGGRRSAEIRQCGMAGTRLLTQGRISWMSGSHLFPFEQPDETAREVLAWIDRLEGKAPASA